MERLKKDRLRFFAFITVCMFVITLFVSGITVNASDNYSIHESDYPLLNVGDNLKDVFSIPDTCLLRSSNEPFIDPNSTQVQDYTNYINNGIVTSETPVRNFGSYLINNDISGALYFCSLPSECFIVGYDDNGLDYKRVYIQKSYVDDGLIFPMYYFPIHNGLSMNQSASITFIDNGNFEQTIDGITYIYCDCNGGLFNSDLAVYVHDFNFSSMNDLGSNSNPNYSSSSSGGSSNNYLVMDSADWNFSNTSFTAPYNVSFNTGSIYPNGNITFSFIPESYQRANEDDYTLTLGFTFDYDVNYKNYNSPFSVFDQTSELLNNKKNYFTTWHYINGSSEYIDIPLSDFISDGCSTSYTFEGIFGSLSSGSNSYESVVSASKELDYVEYNKFNINCIAFISDSNGESSGNYTEWYNPMNKKGYTTDESGKSNKNPYYDSVNNDVSSDGSAPGTAGNSGDNSNNIGGGSGGSSSSSTASNGSIVINNNPTNNVNSGSGYGGSGSGGSGGTELSETASTFWNTFNPFKLIFNKMTDGVEVISDETVEEIGGNRFITVLGDTASYIPSGVWDSLTWFLGASFVILIIAVVLRIILDLL